MLGIHARSKVSLEGVYEVRNHRRQYLMRKRLNATRVGPLCNGVFFSQSRTSQGRRWYNSTFLFRGNIIIADNLMLHLQLRTDLCSLLLSKCLA